MKTPNDRVRVYFAHCILTYNTPLEQRILTYLRERFDVICPNNDIGKLPEFDRYYNLVRWADAVVAHEFRGHVTLGVFNEVKYAIKHGIPVWCIREESDGFVLFKVDKVKRHDPEHWRIYGIFNIRKNDSPLFPR